MKRKKDLVFFIILSTYFVETTYGDGELVFEEQGKLFLSSGHLHIGFQIPFGSLLKSGEHLRRDIHAVLGHFPANNSLLNRQQFASQLAQYVKRVDHGQDSVRIIVSALSRNEPREKRGVFSFLSLGLSAFNSYELYQIASQLDGVQGTTELLSKKMDANSIRITANTEAIHSLNGSLYRTIEELGDIFSAIHVNHVISIIDAMVDQYEDTVLSLQIGTESLFEGKLSLSFLNPVTFMRNFEFDVVPVIKEKLLNTPVQHALDLLSIPTSYLSHNRNLVIIVHVPISRFPAFKLFKFQKMPMQSNGTYFVFDPTADYLAIDDLSGISRELSREELRDCYKLGSSVICSTNILIDSRRNCLTALFKHETSLKCPVKTLTGELAVQTGESEFKMFVPNTTILQFACTVAKRPKLLHRGIHSITVNGGCVAKGKDIQFTPKEMFKLRKFSLKMLPLFPLQLADMENAQSEISKEILSNLTFLLPHMENKTLAFEEQHVHHYISNFIVLALVMGLGLFIAIQSLRLYLDKKKAKPAP